MKKKNSLILDDEFNQYCQLNNITDIDKLAKEIFNRGFSIIKYGETPLGAKGKDIVREKEVIKEVIKEIPVEKIVKVEDKTKINELLTKIQQLENASPKIVEVIKEIPVEKIVEVVKKVPVEKIVEVIKEVPIEIKGDTKIITKEIIKEVPVEKVVEVVKEVPVEKIVEVIKQVPIEKIITKEIINNDEINRLEEENKKLKSDLYKITTALNSFNKAKYMKNSNLYDE